MRRTFDEVVSIHNEYKNGSSQKELDLKYNTDTYYLFKKYKLETRTTAETLQVRRLNRINLDYSFEEISNPTEAYIVGLFMADGWIGRTQAGLRLKKSDKLLVNIVKNYFSSLITLQEDKNSVSFVISSITACNNAKKLGILSNKSSKEIELPLMSSEYYKDFIRGYFDGDGSIFISEKKFLKSYICSPSVKILEEIKEIFDSVGIFSTINMEKRKGKVLKIPGGYCTGSKDMYRLFIRKKSSIEKLYYFLYSNAEIFLDRKKKVFEDNFYMLKMLRNLKHANTEVTIETV